MFVHRSPYPNQGCLDIPDRNEDRHSGWWCGGVFTRCLSCRNPSQLPDLGIGTEHPCPKAKDLGCRPGFEPWSLTCSMTDGSYVNPTLYHWTMTHWSVILKAYNPVGYFDFQMIRENWDKSLIIIAYIHTPDLFIFIYATFYRWTTTHWSVILKASTQWAILTCKFWVTETVYSCDRRKGKLRQFIHHYSLINRWALILFIFALYTFYHWTMTYWSVILLKA